MRVFLDSNILIAAFMWPKGLSAKIVSKLLASPDHRCIIGQYVLEETREKLSEKFGVPESLIAEFESTLLAEPQTTLQAIPLFPPPFPVPDPKDKLVITSALASEADILVTQDKPLLRLSDQVREMKIMDAVDFWNLIR